MAGKVISQKVMATIKLSRLDNLNTDNYLLCKYYQKSVHELYVFEFSTWL